MFRGPAFADGPVFTPNERPKPIAVGGTERISLELGTSGRPLDLPFVACASGDAVEIVSTSSAIITLRGRSAGTARLAIRAPGSGELFDRVDISVLATTAVKIGAFTMSVRLGGVAPRTAVVAGPPAPAFVRMLAGATRVVDESIGGIGPWDLVPIDASPGTTSISIRDGNQRVWAQVVTAADHVDTIVLLGASGSFEVASPLDLPRIVCVEARVGEEPAITGDWRFAAGPDTGIEEVAALGAMACASLVRTKVGEDVLTVTAAGARLDVPLKFVQR